MKTTNLPAKKNSGYDSLFSVLLWLLLVMLSLWARPVKAQNAPDRISTNKEDAWMSCTPSQNPNPARGVSHWIRYDLGFERQLNNSTFWNINHPSHVNSGIREMAIDISSDGTTWNHLGNFILDKANASGFYSGVDGPDFNNATGRYLLFTALSNHGGPCYGLAEIRIEAAQALPVDFVDVWTDCDKGEILWHVTNQSNNSGFYVQQSSDGVDWNDLGFVPSLTHGSDRYSYRVSRESLDGYLRIMQADLNGTRKASKVIQANCSGSSLFEIRPNPTTDMITVEGNLALEGEHYNVYDVNGRVVKAGTFTSGSSIPVSGLAPGIYVISISDVLLKFVVK